MTNIHDKDPISLLARLLHMEDAIRSKSFQNDSATLSELFTDARVAVAEHDAAQKRRGFKIEHASKKSIIAPGRSQG